MSSITRRTVLSGAAATAVTAVAWVPMRPVAATNISAPASGAQNNNEQFLLFLEISAALTGIAMEKLVPIFHNGAAPPELDDDPVPKPKRDYFAHAVNHRSFGALIKAYTDNRDAADPEHLKAAEAVFGAGDEVRNLAYSIVLAWYLGVWTEWNTAHGSDGGVPIASAFSVVSADAYTQGWVWRVAETHPMGYSNLRFGHWAQPPASGAFDVTTFILGGTAK